MSAPLLQLDCTVRRGSFELRADVVSEARVTGLFAPSGSGKTTLLHAIAGLIHPADGFIKVAGSPMVNVRGRWWVPPHRRQVGLLFQEDRLFPHLTVQANLLFGFRRVPKIVRRLQLDEVVEVLRLGALLDRRPPTLSGGEARRVALGRALLASPRLLLLDEPLTGLDAALRRDILAYLLEVPERFGVPLVYVSHTRADFVAMAEVAWTIHQDQVVPLPSPASVLDDLGADESFTSFLRGTVAGEPEPGYAFIDLGRATVLASGKAPRPGAKVRLPVPASEVLLAVGEAPRTSARNVLSGRIASLRTMGARVLVDVDIGQSLLAEVTPAAARELGLREGLTVHALFKARGLYTDNG